jgi:hypothetical protein
MTAISELHFFNETHKWIIREEFKPKVYRLQEYASFHEIRQVIVKNEI